MKAILTKWTGINLSRKQLATNFLDHSVPKNLRNVLAQLSGFTARYKRAQQARPDGFTMDSLGNVRDYTNGYAVGISTYDSIEDMVLNNQNVLACGDVSSPHFALVYPILPASVTYITTTGRYMAFVR